MDSLLVGETDKEQIFIDKVEDKIIIIYCNKIEELCHYEFNCCFRMHLWR